MERLAGVLDGRAVHEQTVVKLVDLLYELCGVLIAVGRCLEHAVFFGLVATEQQQVLYAEKLQIEQLILDIFFCRTATDDVWNDRNVIFVLYGSGYGYRSRAAANVQALKLSVLKLAVHILAVVSRYVDIQRVKVLKLVYC